MRGVVVAEEQVHLVHEYPCVFPGQTVRGHAVLNGLQCDVQRRGLELLPHFVQVEGNDPVGNIHVGLVGEHIQAALHKQLGGQGQFLRLPFRLALQLVSPVGQDGLPGLAAAGDQLMVDIGGTAVNDRLMEGPQLARAHLLLANAHKQLGLHRHGVFAGAVAPGDLQRVDVVGAVGGNLDHGPAQGAGQVPIFSLGVYDDNIIAGGQGDKGDGLLHAEGFAGAGHAQDKAVGVQQPLSVADQEVFADGVHAVVDAPGVLYLLDAEGH